MTTILTRPRPAAQPKADLKPKVVEIRRETRPESGSRAEVEVWNSTFPRRAWLKAQAATDAEGPQVRPAGHERQRDASPFVPYAQEDMERAGGSASATPGLCRTCARWSDCTYPKPEGGVWHCDEHE